VSLVILDSILYRLMHPLNCGEECGNCLKLSMYTSLWGIKNNVMYILFVLEFVKKQK